MRPRALCLLLVFAFSSTLLAITYRNATLMSVRQELRSHQHEIMHNTMLDSVSLADTAVVYQFSVRSGKDLYLSEYVPQEKEQDLPKHWKSQVLIRIEGHQLYIRRADGTELKTQIVKHSSVSSQ